METEACTLAAGAEPRALDICLSSGTGEGPTPLAAFDAALLDAGVANYNLLCLSSVIPPNARIHRSRHRAGAFDHGRRLYVVMSQMRQSRAGRPAHAGIGWVQQGDRGPGLFVELHDEDRDRLEHELHLTLASMCRSRATDYGPVLAVTTFKDEAEALQIANDTPYGLGAGVWSRDGSTAYRMGRAIQAGRVWTNCYHAYPAHATFGGYKESGIGRETHKMMLDHYQQTKNLLVSYSPKALGFF